MNCCDSHAELENRDGAVAALALTGYRRACATYATAHLSCEQFVDAT